MTGFIPRRAGVVERVGVARHLEPLWVRDLVGALGPSHCLAAAERGKQGKDEQEAAHHRIEPDNSQFRSAGKNIATASTSG